MENEETPPLSNKEQRLSSKITNLRQKHNSVLQSARQIFSISINCLQQLHNVKDGNTVQDPGQLTDTIENYKVQLKKYDTILRSEGEADRSSLFSESIMVEHKNKLIQAKVEGDLKGMVEVLLSIRVNALQISPELRKNLVYELIRNDILLLNTNVQNQFYLEIMDIDTPGSRYGALSLLSILVSTLKGIEYVLTNGKSILVKLI